MLSKEEFVGRILEGASSVGAAEASDPSEGIIEGFDGFDAPSDTEAPSGDARFAQLLLEESGFGRGETLPRGEVVLGEQKTLRFLPAGATYWAKSATRPFHILLFDLEQKGSVILSDSLFRQHDQLEDALHRVVQDVLEGFERGGQGRTAARKQGTQQETLCVVSVVDDRGEGPARQIVCFGTKCTATDALEVFTLREEARDWDRPLAEEHLGQLFERHFKKLALGAKWQDAFISGGERKKATALVEACSVASVSGETEETLRRTVRDLLDEIAWSFGIPRRKKNENRCLEMVDLPKNHSIAVDPDESRRKGFENSLRGVRIYDSSERLLGFIVYFPNDEVDLEQLRGELRKHNHFHNVLVIYPSADGPELELWQGPEPLHGRLISGGRRSRFDGEGGIVQLLSRFFVVGKSAIEKPSELAAELAWRAQHLKALAMEELERETKQGDGPLKKLYDIFNESLATMKPEQFADAYAQTITYGMLAARWLSTEKLLFARKNLAKLLPSTSPFLHDLFQQLVNSNFDKNLSWLLDDITSLLARSSVSEIFQGEKDPSIHFYQDFLDAYDPAIRRSMGVYYTPDEVVEYIVRLLDHLARTRLGLRLGLADSVTWGEYAKARGIKKPPGVKAGEFVVQILDPAVGTGTFPLHVMELVFETMTAEFEALGYDDERAAAEWKAYVGDRLLPRLNAFELMMAPYIVTHLRLGLALHRQLPESLADKRGLEGAARHEMVERWGFRFGKKDRLKVFLSNTLEIHASLQMDWLSPHVAQEAWEADRIKTEAPILVVLGNPPYERVAAASDTMAQWLLKGKVPGRDSEQSLFDDILDVARAHTVFSHHASLYDRYVYFWRWVLWKAFEQPESAGLVGLITNATWLTGPGFVGLRQLARDTADEIWTVDLGGDNRGANTEPNVFNIETPVAITAMVRSSPRPTGESARSSYRKISGGSGEEKLSDLEELLAQDFTAEEPWTLASQGSMEPLAPPTGGAAWLDMPPLADIFPWQQPGCKFGRTWPIAPALETLKSRWKHFTNAPENQRPLLFYTGTSGRNIYTSVRGMRRLVDETACSANRPIRHYGYRSFDRQWAFDDPRMAKTDSPSLWASGSTRQVFLVAPMTKQISTGPSAAVSPDVPDLHYFRGSFGGKDVLPLYRDAAAEQPNITHGLLAKLGATLQMPAPSPEELASYVYALLSAVRYQERFAEALKTPGPRVPMTADTTLWSEAVALGKRLLWLHTYTERLRDPATGRGASLPKLPGLTWTTPVTQMPERPSNIKYDLSKQILSVGNGQVAGVRKEVWEYSVSGMQVVKKWLGYRTARGAGRVASSKNPLDRIRLTSWPKEWDEELIELLTVLTITVELQPEQKALLDSICDGILIGAAEFPQPTDAERKPPKIVRKPPKVVRNAQAEWNFGDDDA